MRQGRDREVILIVPTASMAEHLLHTLARQGLAVPNRVVQTVAAFVHHLTPDLTEPDAALESWLLMDLLRQTGHEDFRRFASNDGFREQLAGTLREVAAAGCTPQALNRFCRNAHQKTFREIFDRFETQLAERGYVPHGEKLRQASGHIAANGLGDVREVYLDGFHQLSLGENALVKALAKLPVKLVATVPAGVESTFPDLPVQRLETVWRPRAKQYVIRARTAEHEVEEIARRILDTKRPFHEYAVIARSPEVYGPLIDEVFERFHIPYRMKGAAGLARHGAVSYLRKLLRCVVDGFDERDVLALVSQQWSPCGLTRDADTFDFEVRKRLPGSGMDFLLGEADRFPKVRSFLEALLALDGWTREQQPAATWSQRVCQLKTSFVRLPEVPAGLDMPKVLDMRRTARALEAFDRAADQAARLWPDSTEINFADYLQGLDLTLTTALLPDADARRNVVNVLTAYEARQWELPVVFVCGLVEKQFPRHHPQDLFFPDADRRRLQKAGIQLRTTDDRESEERLLFDSVTTRATDSLFLTYPEANEEGRVTVRSFFIETPKEDDLSAPAVRVNEKPAAFKEPHEKYLTVDDVRESMLARHGHFRPSSIETYLQCPFQFFGRDTLKLEGPPDASEWRITNLLSGTIVHETLQRWGNTPGEPIAAVLSEVFNEICDRESIQPSFRTAVTFNNLRADLENFAQQEASRDGATVRERLFETKVEFVVEAPEQEPFQLNGRIDRYELFEENLAVVVDYKYSAKAGMDKLAAAHEQGRRVQGALYLLGLEQVRGVKPGGIRYWGLRGDTTRVGWISTELGGEALDGKEKPVSPGELREILHQASETTAKAIEEIRQGRVEAAPYDTDPCLRYCELRDVCRIRL